MKNFNKILSTLFVLLLMMGSYNFADAQSNERDFVFGASHTTFTGVQMVSFEIGGVEYDDNLENPLIITMSGGALFSGNRFSADVLELGSSASYFIDERAFVRGGLGLRVFGEGGDTNDARLVGSMVDRSGNTYLTGHVGFGGFVTDWAAPYVRVGSATNFDFANDVHRIEFGAGLLIRPAY